MGRKNFKSYPMLDDASMATTQQSVATNVQLLDKASIHVSWTGTAPVGVLTVQARNGENDTWYDLDFGVAMNVTGNSGDHQIIFNELPFYEIQLVYTATSGTGSIDAVILMKQVGG